jgi:hypothetical protein
MNNGAAPLPMTQTPPVPHDPTVPSPTVLDIEASGLGRSSYPIEVGYVLPDGHAYCTLVQPEPEWTHWDEGAAALHRITRDLLQARGLPAREVALRLNTQLAGQTVYSDGWANDYTWLSALFEAAEMSPHFKLENLRSLLTEQEADQWHQVKAQIASERGTQRHRASSDARLLQLTLQRLRGPH